MPSARLFDDPNEESRYANQVVQRRQMAAAMSVTEDDAARLRRLRRAHPYLDAKVTIALAKAGMEPDDPRIAQLGQATAKKKSRGLGWHTIGDVVSVGAKGITKAADFVVPERLEDAAGEAGEMARAVVRGGITTLAAPFEELQGQVRNVYSATRGRDVQWLRPQSQFGVAIEQRLRGERVDMGHGFLPGGDVAKTQAQRAREAATIDGHALTVGRLVAHQVFEPDSKPYSVLSGLLDAGTALLADPAQLGLTRVSRTRLANKAFLSGDLGLIRAPRLAFDPQKYEAWKTSAGPLARYLADETDEYRLFKNTKGKVPVDVINRLVDSRSEDEVWSVLDEVMGTRVRERITLPRGVAEAGDRPLSEAGFQAVFRRDPHETRLLQQMPAASLDPENADDAVEQSLRYLRNAKVPDEEIGPVIRDVMRATTPGDRYKAIVGGVFKSVESSLRERGAGINPKVARRMTTAWKNHHSEALGYFRDTIGDPVDFPGVRKVVLGGVEVPVASPHLPVELLHNKVPLPNVRDIRTATSRFGNILTNPAVDVSTSTLHFLMEQVWKPMVLLRGAWGVRVIGEEQARLGAVDKASAFCHPLSYIAWTVADDGRTGKALERVGVATGRGRLVDATEEGQAALSRTFGGWIDRGVRYTGRYQPYRRLDEGFREAWAGQAATLASDPLVQKVMRDGPEATKEWFANGGGRGFLDELDEAFGGGVFRQGPGGVVIRSEAERYVDSIMERVKLLSAGDAQVQEAIATGRFNGKPISVESDNGFALDLDFRKHVEELADRGVGPDVLWGPEQEFLKKGSRTAQFYDQALQWMFSTAMARPTNYFSRSPAFRQFFFQRAEELMPLMDEAGQRQMLDFARANKLDAKVIDSMERFAQRGTGKLSFDEADLIARGFGLDSTKELLYDLANRSQMAEALRLVAPFTEAWREVLTRWAKLATERPETLRRGSRAIMAARQPGSGVINAVFSGNEQVEGQGFFYKDPTTGEEVFGYPGSELITDALVGVPVRLSGRVEGLNIFSNSILPGFGPVVQVPASIFLPDHPDWDGVRGAFLPFGEHETEGGFVESFLPAWLKKFRQAGLLKFAGVGPSPEGQRLFNNTVFDVMRHLVADGQYERPSTPEQMERLVTAAKTKAKWLYVIRGGSQFWAPSAPAFTFMERDKTGNMTFATKLVELYQRLSDPKQGGNPQTAAGRFLDLVGDDFYLYMQPKSRSLVGGSPVTSKAQEWLADNSDLVRDYPTVHGFFAPQGGEFDIGAYGAQFRRSKREALSPDLALRLANARVGSVIYNRAKAKVGLAQTREERDFLGRIREALVEEFPGFRDETILARRASVDQQLRELVQIADDPRLEDNEVTRTLRVYLKARDKALAVAEARGLKTLGGQSVADVATWVRGIGDALVEEEPEFGPLFEYVLSRELPREEVAA